MTESVDKELVHDLLTAKNPYEEVKNAILSVGFKNIVSSIDPIINTKINVLGSILLQAAERGNVRMVEVFLEEKFLVNYRNPATGQTALHLAAAYEARKVLDALIDSGQVDYLIRDNQGRLASELAFTIADDVEVAEVLRIQERKQADAQGIKLTRRP